MWWLIAPCWGALNGWNYRHLMNPDGLSYIDMGREALRHGPGALVNAYWSPLYPALIALWNLVARPEPLDAFVHVHALNAVIYVLAAVAFGFFLRELILFREPDRGPLWKQGAFVAFAFVVFLRYTNAHILPFAVTPDILLSATIFAAAGFVFRILRQPDGRRSYVALGCMLALGYYAKSVMIPAAICLFAMLALLFFRVPARLRNVAIAAGVMLLLCAPQIVAVSLRVGSVSIGESGRLNHLWSVQEMRQFQGWTGTAGGDMPVHGPRRIVTEPEVLEFATPLAGSYPLWYDPAYWYAGAKMQFDPGKQWAAFKRNLVFFKDYPLELGLPAAGLIVLGIFAAMRRGPVGRRELYFALWPLSVLLMYLLLYIEFRYVAPWLVLFFVACYSAVLVRNAIPERVILLLLGLTFLSLRVVDLVSASRILTTQQGASTDMLVASELQAIGLRGGDTIAIVGEGFQHYYAHLADTRIVAQISDPRHFWSLTPSHVLVVEEAVAQTGAKALVAMGRPASFQPSYWRPVAGTAYSILPLR